MRMDNIPSKKYERLVDGFTTQAADDFRRAAGSMETLANISDDEIARVGNDDGDFHK